MSKSTDMLQYMQQNIGKWCCSVCASNSNQPAAIFRELKKQGYLFEEVSPNRWAKEMHCKNCKTTRSHYKLLKKDPVFESKQRIPINQKQRERVIRLLKNEDAFTGASISSKAEIDHKTPWTRLDKDINIDNLSDSQITAHFQLLTREHNLLKDRMCTECRKTSIRPPFFGISFWYKGNKKYNGTCEGCGWYDGKKWRETVAEILKKF